MVYDFGNDYFMNVKGIRLYKKLAVEIQRRIDDIPQSDLEGALEPFGDFEWKSFRIDEFKGLLAVFASLIARKCFSNVSEEHLFVFNFSSGVTEMDIVTVLRIGGKGVFLDIETKNGDDPKLKNKVLSQIRKRNDEHIPQLVNKDPYLVVGFVNEEFVEGIYFDGDKKITLKSFDKLSALLSDATGDVAAEEYLFQFSSIASIVKVCKSIREHTYSFFEDTRKVSEQLTNYQRQCDCAVVYGNAGTGKSVLALKLFFENPESKLLLLNSKLYYAMDLVQDYRSGRATYNSSSFVNLIDKDTISIIDECQRLSLDQMAMIVKLSKFTYLFGDNRQAFSKDGFPEDARKLTEKLSKETSKKIVYKILKKSKRYSDDVSKVLDTLTSLDGRETKNEKLTLPCDFSVEVVNSEKQFLAMYDRSDGIKKIYVPIADSRNGVIRIGDRRFDKAISQYDTFSVWPSDEALFGITYHALSFDIDHCFVFLDKLKYVNFQGKKYFYTASKGEPSSVLDIRLYLNELNVLFTRGRKSLTIYVEDVQAYLHLLAMVNEIKRNYVTKRRTILP